VDPYQIPDWISTTLRIVAGVGGSLTFVAFVVASVFL